MQVNDILKNPNFQLLTKQVYQPDYSGLYAGDLLSWIMAHAKSTDILLTIMSNMNSIAVGTLLDLPAIIFCDGVVPSSDMIERADQEALTLITTSLGKVEVVRVVSNCNG